MKWLFALLCLTFVSCMTDAERQKYFTDKLSFFKAKDACWVIYNDNGKTGTGGISLVPDKFCKQNAEKEIK